MLRLAPDGLLRLSQSLPGRLNASFGGGEANVAVTLCQLGTPARFLTALPAGATGDAAISDLRRHGVDVSCVLRRKAGRLGLYFLETGANQRPSTVSYNREGSAISMAGPDEYDFSAALNGVGGVHVTGITPAISEHAFRAALELVSQARKSGAQVSCDLNFRKKLWNWRPGTKPGALARECMAALLEHVDVVIGNEEDAEQVLGIGAEGTSVESGRINAAAYTEVARSIVQRFPGVRLVAITLRESVSATHNNWGGMLYDAAAGQAHFAPLAADGSYAPYEIRDIVDRVGGGDSFAGGLIHALARGRAPADALAFAVAASCLKHSIVGDFNAVSDAEVAALMKGDVSGRVKR